MNILTFTQWEKTTIVIGQLNRKEWERDGKICRLVIVQSGLRLRRVRNGHVKKIH